MATARIGRRRRHKLHKRVATIRARLRRWCSHVFYDFDRCATVLVPRQGGDTTFAISDYAIYAAAPPLLMHAFFGGSLQDWQRPGFALRLLAPFARGVR